MPDLLVKPAAEAAGKPVDMAQMPVQLPTRPGGPAEARARFFNSGNAFNVKLPPVVEAAQVYSASAMAANAMAGAITFGVNSEHVPRLRDVIDRLMAQGRKAA